MFLVIFGYTFVSGVHMLWCQDDRKAEDIAHSAYHSKTSCMVSIIGSEQTFKTIRLMYVDSSQ